MSRVNRMMQVAVTFGLALVLGGATLGGPIKMLVSDTLNDRILQYDVTGTTVTYEKVFGQASYATIGLDGAMGMALGADGRIYIGEQRDNGRVLRFAQDGTFLGVMSEGVASRRPESVESGPDGNIYFTDAFGSAGDKVYKLDLAGPTTSVFIPQSGGSYSLNNPRGLSFDPDGNAYISDRNNNRILKFDGATGAFLSRFDSGGAPTLPQDLTWHNGELYVSANTGGGINGILRYNPDGTFKDTFLSAAIGTNIGVSGLGSDIYTADYVDNKVYRRTGPAGVAQVVPAGGEPTPAVSGPGHVLFFSEGTPVTNEIVVLDASADAHVNLSDANNYGSLTYLRVGDAGASDPPGTYEAFIRFDLPPALQGATVVSAIFQGVQTDASVGGGFEVYEVTGAWTELGITGATLPTIGAYLDDMLVNPSTLNGGISVLGNQALTQLVQDWIDGAEPNFGLSFHGLSFGDTLASREDLTHLAPQLIITYLSGEAIPEPGTLALVAVGVAALARRRRRRR